MGKTRFERPITQDEITAYEVATKQAGRVMSNKSYHAMWKDVLEMSSDNFVVIGVDKLRSETGLAILWWNREVTGENITPVCRIDDGTETGRRFATFQAWDSSYPSSWSIVSGYRLIESGTVTFPENTTYSEMIESAFALGFIEKI